MTSAPVKDVGALMNFIGGKNLTKTGGTDLMSSFGDAMSKATGGNSGTDSQSQAVSDKKMTETKPAEALKSRKDVVKAEKSEAKKVDIRRSLIAENSKFVQTFFL